MNINKRIVSFLAVAFLAATPALVAESSQPPADDYRKPVFWMIPHTHWEGAVFITREEYLETALSDILTVLRLLKEYPDYRFTLDQVAYFRPFLERYPEEASAFREFVAEGRLQIVGGLDIMPERQHALRRVVCPPDALCQGILPRGAGHRR